MRRGTILLKMSNSNVREKISMENFTNLYKDDERVDLKEGWISLRWCIEDVDYVIEEHGYVFN